MKTYTKHEYGGGKNANTQEVRVHLRTFSASILSRLRAKNNFLTPSVRGVLHLVYLVCYPYEINYINYSYKIGLKCLIKIFEHKDGPDSGFLSYLSNIFSMQK